MPLQKFHLRGMELESRGLDSRPARLLFGSIPSPSVVKCSGQAGHIDRALSFFGDNPESC